MNRLSIFDVSAFVHSVRSMGLREEKDLGGFNYTGVKYLIKYLALEMRKGMDIVLCFDSKSFRKDLDKNYKSGRCSDPVIVAQLEVLWEMLPKCGFVCLKREGWEADDLINYVVTYNHERYDRIKILANDMDLAALVTNKVRLENIRTDSPSIDKDNFSSAVITGEFIPYNLLRQYKILVGDKSDNIKPFRRVEDEKSGMSLGRQMFSDYKLEATSSGELEKYSDGKTFLTWIVQNSSKYGLSQQDVNNLAIRYQLVYPKVMLESDWAELQPLFDSSYSSINQEQWAKFLTIFKAREAMELLRIRPVSVDKRIFSYFKKKQESIVTGEYMADNNLSLEKSSFFRDSSFSVKGLV